MHISYRIYVLYMLYVHVRFKPYAMFVTPCAIVAILSLYLSFFRFGLLVRTQSGPYGFCHHPYTLAHIKGFRSPVCMSMLACFYALSSVLASLVLDFAMLDALNGLWLCGYI